MQIPSPAIATLLRASESGVIHFELLQRLAVEHKIEQPELMNKFADHIARAYYSGMINFETADQAMNAAFSVCCSEAFWEANDRVVPEAIFSVYQAFDEGEYRHRHDSERDNPKEKYTRPLIIQYLRSNGNDA